MGNSPLAQLADFAGATVIDCAPIVGVILDEPTGFQAHFEVKTRAPSRSAVVDGPEAPISIYLTVRRHGPIADLKDIPAFTRSMIDKGEEFDQLRVVAAPAGPDSGSPWRWGITEAERAKWAKGHR